ncbi:modulator protein [Aliidongia dinghuensis]|uniref:Modulator protein n=1 Tax=Aliidongia dinghuensis TaxID=1867774 RepID=A0A8J2YU08_9PROT|nr:TldD/PmbA family protein [Aliidongia dinghuensis]GGF16159.1 modulator protein [Aliidongia dinghuensis]
MTATDQALDLLTDLIARAKRAGADHADGVLFEGISIAHAQRLGEIEKLERSEGYDLGLRVLVGKRQAIVSSNDRSATALDALVERAIAMARVVPEDEFCGIAAPDEIARDWPKLDMVDPDEPATSVLIERAARAEAAARAVAGVTNSDGAEASWSMSRVALVASNGFAGGYAGSGHGVSVSVIAGTGDGMERESDWSSAVYGADLEDAELVGRRAGERAVRRVGARKMPTARVPVVYDPRVASGLIGHLAGAISGPSIARKTSFLKDKLGQQLFSSAINIIDDPHRQRGHRSKPFDGEGIANRRRALIENGVLTTWLLDLRSARQLGLKSTGHAARGTSSPPGPSTTNLYLEPGSLSPTALMADIESGLYITSLMGQGVNGVNGDYSRGASGFWIEKGEITFPVNEITVAGNLIEMFRNLTAANDLEFRGGTNAPTVRIDGMTVAGA